MSKSKSSYWHSRGYKNAPLAESSSLISKIENGDFDRSYFYKLIEKEKAAYRKLERELREHFTGSDDAWQEHIAFYRRRSHMKCQELEERAAVDETYKLALFRQRLIEEFGADWWDELTVQCDGGPKDLYELYKQKSLTNEKVTN